MPDFRGYLSDLGGPSANMYMMRGKDRSLCERCKRPSCISPSVCPNLNADHQPLIDIYKTVDALPGIKKSFIGSGVRYDLLLNHYKDPALCEAAKAYTRELILHHVSGRLKVAPEHTSDRVLKSCASPPSNYSTPLSVFSIISTVRQDFANKSYPISYRHTLDAQKRIWPNWLLKHAT